MNPRVLIIGFVWPEFQSSAAGIRTWNLIETFLNAKWELIFASSSKFNSFSDQMKYRGIEIHSVQPNDPTFDDWIKKLCPDLVIFDRFMIEEQFGWRVWENNPKSIRVVDTVDLHFLRRNRESQISNQPTKKQDQELYSDTILRELASLYRSDGALVLSEYEYHLLVEQYKLPLGQLHLSPLHYPKPDPESSPSFEDREGFSIIGNFRHSPNLDSIFWFHSILWPKMQKLFMDHGEGVSGALAFPRVYIYGAYPPKSVMDLHDEKSGFHVIGQVPDAISTLKRHRVNLAPLRFGAGIKGKITDGWQAGTPVVTTPIGAEGMNSHFPWGGEIATTDEEFAQKAVYLYFNKNHWISSQKKGFIILDELYNVSKNELKLIQYFSHLLKNRDSLRSQNLIGHILWHQTLRSTKYFSKWIEMKAKIKD